MTWENGTFHLHKLYVQFVDMRLVILHKRFLSFFASFLFVKYQNEFNFQKFWLVPSFMFLRLNGKWDYMANIHWLSLWFSIALFQKSDRNLSKTLIFFVLSWSNLQSFPYFNPSNLRDRNFTVYLYLNSQLVTSNQKQIISGCYCITAVYCWKPKKVCVQTLVDFFSFYCSWHVCVNTFM